MTKNDRRHRRFIITLHGKVTIGEKSYDAIVGNVSEEGLSSTVTTYIKTDKDFSPNKSIRLIFDLPSGETINLACEIRWYLKPQDNGENLILGLYIVDPPPQYTRWINSFQ